MGKPCSKCGSVKPLDEFHRFAAARDGHRAECKACACERGRHKYVARSRTKLTLNCQHCAEGFSYTPTTGQVRIYCSARCRHLGGEALKLGRASQSTRACVCGSTDVARVGRAVCATCRKDRRNTETARIRERARSLQLYHLTAPDYDRMLATQGHRCAVCKTDSPGNRGESWSVDHDHQCCPGPGSCGACVRGLLCTGCNVGLGYFRDNPEALRAAAIYLDSRALVGAA